MNKKSNYLSIGKMSKITGMSIKSLRYYDQVGILKPVYTNEETGYRYYSFEQIYIVEFIELCLRLDVKLKELMQFIEEDNTIHFAELLEYAREISDKKLRAIQRGQAFMNFAKDEIKRAQFTKDYLYTQEKDTKVFVLPYTPPFSMEKLSDKLMEFEEISREEWTIFAPLRMGLLHEYKNKEINRYCFFELIGELQEKYGNFLLPKGDYLCHAYEDSHIEQVKELFPEIFRQSNRVIAMESELFSSNYQINKPKREVMILGMD